MEEITEIISISYYTMPIMYGLQAAVLVLSFLNRNKFNELRFFHLYPIAGFIQSNLYFLAYNFLDTKIAHQVNQCAINIFSILEVALFYYFTTRRIQIKKLRKTLYVSFTIFCLYCSFVWCFTDAFLHNASRLYIIEGVMLLILNCSYFIQLFKLPPFLNLFDQPALWINMGILSAFCLLLPLNFLQIWMEDFYFSNDNNFFYINYVAYSLLYIFIARAYLCKSTRVANENLIVHAKRPAIR